MSLSPANNVTLNAATQPTTWPATRATLMSDTVHVMPPFGAHGVSTALRDAAPLSEKLQAAFAQGQAFEQAIAAYQAEMLAYSFKEVESSKARMKRFNIKNPFMSFVMLRALPRVNSLMIPALAEATH